MNPSPALRRTAGASPLLALLVACGSGPPPVPAAPPAAPRVQRALDDLAASVPAGHTVAVRYVDLATDARADLAPTVVLHAASTMKLAVMLELFRRADAGELDIDAPILLENRFASIVDGSPFTLDPADDSDPELYERIGTTVPLRELLRRMIVRSSNLATNVLVAIADPARIQATIEGLGATAGMRVLRGVEDGKAYAAGLSNVTTAADLATLLEAIARHRAASAAACDAMLAILRDQEFDELIPAGLPAGTVVAHKTGSITRIQHDAAIVDPDGPRPYVLVVLTAGFEDPVASAAVIAQVARAVHAARQ